MHTAARQASDATGEVYVMRNLVDPDEILVILGWRDLHHARAFMRSVSWQMAQKEMGVVGVPEVWFWESES